MGVKTGKLLVPASYWRGHSQSSDRAEYVNVLLLELSSSGSVGHAYITFSDALTLLLPGVDAEFCRKEACP